MRNKNQKLTWLRSFKGEETSMNITIRMQEKVRDESEESGFKRKGNSVLYKNDELRFSQQCTLKLKTFTLYDIAVEVANDQHLIHMDIGGKIYNCFKLYDNPDNSTKVYVFTWSTAKINPTERKHRTILPVEMKFKGYKELKFQFSVKFYYKDEVLHFSGLPLTLIDVHAQVGVGEFHHTVLSDISFE